MYMKPIDNYEDRYYILTTGQVFSRKHGSRSILKKDIELKTDTNSCGYQRVTLSKDGKTKRFFVHRLVAEHFLPKPANWVGRLEVNHKDGDKTNNSLENLEWSSGSENKVHALETGLRKSGEKWHASKATNAQVRAACELIQSGWRRKDILEATGLSVHQFFTIKSRKLWKHISKDYVW